MSDRHEFSAAHVRLMQIETERWPVHLATGGGWCGPGRLFLACAGGPVGIHLEAWEVGLAEDQKVLVVARSWDTTIEFFATVRRCTDDGRVIVSWPEELDVAWALSETRPESVPGEDREAA